MTSPKIGFLCGSLRTGSTNKILEKALIEKVKTAGAETTVIDLAKYDLPLYHGDLKTPATVKTLIRDMKSCDGVIIVTPEYNGSLPPVLKNAIDWTSTVETGHLTGPIYGIASCTPGPMSGIMVMRQVQYILTRLGANVVPIQTGCGNSSKAFDTAGHLVAEPAGKLADGMIASMIKNISLKD